MMTAPTDPQPPQDEKTAAEATSGTELLNWAVEQFDAVRQGKLDADGIKNLVSEAGTKLASFFNRS